MTESDFRMERDKALFETTAQTIFNTLREIEADRPLFASRWPWELLQNAVDVAKQGGADCTFILTEDELVFRHDGLPFKMKEIAHLIYHGTTKTEESGKIRFGTGFITTHLLSRRTILKGLIEGGIFGFELNRNGDSWKELERNMGDSESQFLGSLKKETVLPRGTTVEYRYPLSDKGRETAVSGIQSIKTNVSFVLALNDKLHSVTIIVKGKVTEWSKVQNETKNVSGGIVIVPVQSRSNEQDSIYSVAVAHEGQVATALLMAWNGSGFVLQPIQAVPKLFYDFPLTSTESFPLPCVINSPLFIPTEKRNGLLLGYGDEIITQQNKALIENGLGLFSKLVKYVTETQCRDLTNLAKITGFSDIPDRNRLDSDWMKTNIAKLIDLLRTCNLVERDQIGQECVPISPEAAHIPYADDPDTQHRIWSLAQGIFPESLPSEESLKDWVAILDSWASYLGTNVERLGEVFTLDKLASMIASCGSLDILQDKLKGDPKPSAIEWLNELLGLISEKHAELLSTIALVSDQLGFFRKKEQVSRDENTDEELKDIICMLGNNMRERLCDVRINLAIQNSLIPYNEETLLAQTVSLLKKKADLPQEYSREEYYKANAMLFCWLAEKCRYQILSDNFPVINYKMERGEPQYISRLLQKQPLLKPVSYWDEAAKPYADLFPDHMILSEIYSAYNKNKTVWSDLAKEGLILDELLIKSKDCLSDNVIRKLLAEPKIDEQTEHGTKNEVDLTTIAFLESTGDWGILERSRRSKAKATLLLKFLMNYVIRKDTSWMTPVDVQCICKEKEATHRILPSKWLYALKWKEWVPIGKNKEERASVENLAPLFQQDQDLLKSLMEDQPAAFLNALGISPSQIIMTLQTVPKRLELDKAFMKLLLATDSNADELARLSELYQNPGLRMKLEEAYINQGKVTRNQKIGNQVEQILRELLGKSLPVDKYAIRKITKGADIGIDVDFDSDLVNQDLLPMAYEVQVKNRSFVIEVKSTHFDYVRITMPQAREAVGRVESFILCVVELPDDGVLLSDEDLAELVRNRSRFILKLGSKLEDRLREAEEFKKREVEIKTLPLDNVMIDTTGTQIRLRLRKVLWTTGELPIFSYSDLVDTLIKLPSPRSTH